MIKKNKIKSFILDYLKKEISEFKTSGKLFTCPSCGKTTANLFPPDSNIVFCLEPNCGKQGDIFDICRKRDFDNNYDVPKEEIADYLIDLLKIKTNEHIDELLENYKIWGWDLVANEKNTKMSNREKEWQKKNHKNIREWKQWLDSELNIGVKTGAISQTICIDFDLVESKLKKKIYSGKYTEEDLNLAKEQHSNGLKTIKEKMQFLDWTTVNQTTFGGVHLFYKYNSNIPKSSFDFEGIHIDVENDLGQVVIEPSIVGGQQRTIYGNEIKEMSEELCDFLLDNTIQKSKIVETTDTTLEQSFDKIIGLDGCCNNTFAKVGGMFRKFMNVKQVKSALNIINTNMLDDPMNQKSIKLLLQQIEKYHKADLESISSEILNHMKIVQDAHVRDLKECLGYERVDLEQALRYLCDHKKLYKIKKDLYRLIEDVEWQEDFMSIGKPLEYAIPYFSKYNNFDNGSMSVMGAVSGTGKTYMCCNIIKRLVDAGIKPCLLSVEGGGGFRKVVTTLGLKEGDFEFKIVKDPSKIPLKNGVVTLIDWLKAPEGEHARTDVMYESINDQLIEKGGHVIIFAQLKKQSKEFYAENMVEHYASFVGKFLYPSTNGILDNLNPYIQTTKMRDSVNGLQYVKIPLSFNRDTKVIMEKK